MTKQPDRWEREAEQHFSMPDQTWSQTIKKVAKLLRNEHRAAVRMVKQRQPYCLEDGGMRPDDKNGNWIMRNILLDQLNERAK